MAFSHDICIRGAGIVGRTLALLLAREGLRVALVEPPANPAAPDVRAYALNSAARQLLTSVRCWPDAQEGTPAVTPVQAMQVFGDAGGLLHFRAADTPPPGSAATELNWMVDVPALQAQLASAVRFQPRIEVLDAPVPAALTVICEGRASQTRAELGVAFDISPYDQHAVAARLRCATPHDGVARQWFRWGQAPGLTALQAEILALLPLGGEGGHDVALVWSVHPARARELQTLDAEAFAQSLGSACDFALGGMTLISERAVWPLQLARAERWIGLMPGRTDQAFALAGDAAHALHPLAGQGLNVGLADVAALVQVIHDKEFWRPLSDLRLLRRYERRRAADVLAMGLVTDGLQRLFAQPGSAWQQLRNWGLRGFDHSGPFKHWMTRQAMGTGPGSPGA